MKIVAAELDRVRYPMVGTKVTAHNAVSEHFRTIVRLFTECGRVGLGECSGHPDSWRLAGLIAKESLGRDPHDAALFRFDFARANFHQRNGRNGWIAYGAIETAFFDLQGKHADRPLFDLLGGACRKHIRVVKGLSAVPLAAGATRNDVENFVADLGNVDRLVGDARRKLGETGIGSIKLKSAAISPDWDVAALSALREAFGPEMKLRLDPNAGYSPARAISLFTRLDPLNLEYFEDPTGDIEGMARLKRHLRTPLATNMCVIQFEHIPCAIQMNSVDIVLGDVYHWGGVTAVRDLAAVCEVMGLGFGIHSTLESEWDIGVACNLHLAAALPAVRHAIDGHFPSADGGIVKEQLKVKDGAITVPEGPGLGVTLDEAKIQSLSVDRQSLSL